MNDFPGQYLRQVRRDYGITQAQLAKAMGMSRFGINQIERGRQSITANSALRFERVFRHYGVTAVDLMRRQAEDDIRFVVESKQGQLSAIQALPFDGGLL